MITFSVFDKTKIPLLSRALDAYSLRQKVIASNIANIDTEGYSSKSVTFDQELSEAMNEGSIPGVETNEHHLPIGKQTNILSAPRVIENAEAGAGGTIAPNNPLASGANDVDIDREMAELAKNQIRFKYAARLLSETFKGIQKSIRGTQ